MEAVLAARAAAESTTLYYLEMYGHPSMLARVKEGRD